LFRLKSPQPPENIRKIPLPSFADNFAPHAHNQLMSAHPANSFSCRGHSAKKPRRPLSSGSQSRLSTPSRTALSIAQCGPFVKKPALRLVQSQPNPFIININSEKSRRKNEKKRPEIALFRPFSVLFGEFFGTPKAPINHPTPLTAAASTAGRYGRYAYGMAEVWKRYKALP
jgi:hypothetical protein